MLFPGRSGVYVAAMVEPTDGVSSLREPSLAVQRDERSRDYYDEFSQRYDERRGRNVPGGYHDLLDDLEVGLVERFGKGGRVLEVGCGTGLLLSRMAEFASLAHGIDLSPGMLDKARARGLSVTEASATQLPFDDASFDVTCSFKVLAHVEDIGSALEEMSRVTRPGGVILAEFYNPLSIRGLLRRLGPSQKIGSTKKESDVFTRFDTPREARTRSPSQCRFEGARGIRILTPSAWFVDHRIIGPWFYRAETALADTRFAAWAGFYVAIYRKHPG